MEGLGKREIARRIALVEQQAETEERISARATVELGRTPHLGPLAHWSDRDDAIVRHALRDVGMLDMAERSWHSLSGGERQRLHIARAFAQQPDVLLLDEPTNHLDIGHQIGLLDLVRRRRKTVVAALHDLNHAAMFCDRLILLHRGALYAEGRPREVLTVDNLAEVFAIDAHVEWAGEAGCHIRYRRPVSPTRHSISISGFEVSL
jgi:iron complex transport system ATP-binding protein